VGCKLKKIIMKKILILLLIPVFFSCTDETTGNVSKVTNYPIIEVVGADPIFVAQGGAFTDPGVIAKEGEAIIPTVTTVTGNYRGGTSVDTSKPDEYTITYTATNVDGFKGAATRKVIVYKTGNLVNSIEGVYTCTISRNGVTPSAAYRNIKYIYIWKNTDGTYELSDAFGGWYQYGRALGLPYITPGGTINAIDIAANNFTFPGNPLTNSGFGGTANLKEMTVNAATKTIVFRTTWTAPTAYTFVATLTQVQL
jgi:hypothetical protein